MKRTVIAVTIMILILVTGTVYAYWRVCNSAEELLTRLEAVKTEVEAGHWQQAKEKAQLLKDRWEKIEDLWTPLLDHSRVSELENSITRLVELVNLEEETDARAELALSKRLVQNVPNTERLTLKNIF
jgi:hypothetical protein